MSENLLNQLEEFQKQYYTENTKNTFFKKSQKSDLAQKISESIDIQQLLNETAYSNEATNKVFINYSVFKMFANSNNYDAIITHILGLFQGKINSSDNYECHINLNGFTVSAAERYKDFVRAFCNRCLGGTTPYSSKLFKMCIYHPSTMIQQISKLFTPFTTPEVRDKVIILTKAESDRHWPLQ